MTDHRKIANPLLTGTNRRRVLVGGAAFACRPGLTGFPFINKMACAPRMRR